MNGGQFLYTFAYNADGIRTVKTNGSTIHHYTLNGSQIVTVTKKTKRKKTKQTGTPFLFTGIQRDAAECAAEVDRYLMGYTNL